MVGSQRGHYGRDMTPPEDADLLARYAAGEEPAARAMYERFAGPILTVGLAILGKRDLAEEVVQVTLLNVWRSATSFDTSRELAPWVYAIARRVAVDIYRREKRTDLPTDMEDGALAVEPLSFERTWEVWNVRWALDRLPQEERDIIRLSHLVRMTHREIADHLGVPLGTVKSRSARAHQRLATLLGHMGEAER
jgi:RNA polymerase sigma-70 factor, ECF subfamily